MQDWSGQVIPCTMISGADLAQLAESMDDLLVYQVGTTPLPDSEISRITESLRSLAWPLRDLMSDPHAMKRILVRQVTDRLARLRLTTGRHVLAGVSIEFEGETERKTLLIVIAPIRVESCDFEIRGRSAA
ncbi:hypothetical protein [Dongia sp.]|uniref:hypothetical protein n=1 Tax=Dongia sp. TaxID=1977262 RepID=UPI003751B857